MVTSVEIPEPLFEVEIEPRWDKETNSDVFTCSIIADHAHVVFRREYRVGLSDLIGEDEIRHRFVGEFSERFKKLMEES